MTAEVVECFLSNCVFLERISLLGAELGNLRVVGSSIALKHLELHAILKALRSMMQALFH